MLLRILAGAALLLLLWWAFRLSMGLRWSKIERERARRQEEETGRQVVAELPLPEGVVFFVADPLAFHWGDQSVPRGEVTGARLLNSAVVSAAARAGAALPDPPSPEDEPGRDKWEVAVYLRDGRALVVRCGSVREGISRDAARAVFEALRREVQA